MFTRLVAVLVSLSFAVSAFVINPADDHLALWLDAKAVGSVVTGVISGGMSSDSATFSSGGVAATDGAPVALWHDQRTPTASNLAGDNQKNSVFYAANNGAVGNTAQRPIYVADAYKGQPGISFDGADDRLITWDGSMPALLNEHTIIVFGIAERSSNGQSDTFFYYSRYGGTTMANAPGLAVYKDASGRHLRMFEPGGVDTFNSPATALLDEPALLMQVRRAVGGDYVTDGYIVEAVTSPWVSRTVANTNVVVASGNNMGFQIGQLGNNAQYLDGAIMELIVYNRALSTAELADLQGYLYLKWGIPEPSSLALLGLAALPLLRRRCG